MGSGLNRLQVAAIAVGTMAAVTLTSIAVVTGFKNTGLVDNTTADAFVTGLTVFGTFIGVIVLALVGKMIVDIFRSK